MRNLALLAAVNFFWALQFPASRVASQELGGMTLTWFAMLTAAILMVPLAQRERHEPRQKPPSGVWQRWLPVILLGVSGSLVAQMCLNWGLERSPASNAAVINLTVPILMAVLASLILGERMSPARWIAFALSVPGVILASNIRWNETSFFENQYLLGNGLVFLSCWGSAFYNVYSKQVLDWLGPAQLLVASFAISLVVLFPAMLIYEPHPVARLFVASSSALFGLVLISVFSLALATLIFFRVLGEVDATQASLSIYLMPVFGVLVSGAALNEKVSLSLIAGGLLVGAGAWLVTVWEQRAAKRSMVAS